MSELLQLRARQPDWLLRRDPRLRLLAAGLTALTVLSLERLPTLLLALGLALTLALLMRLPLRQLLGRLLAFEGFMLLVLVMLPFSIDGDPLLTLAGFSASWQGLERALVIVLRANCVVVTLLALLGTLAPETLGHALARLGVPDKLVHLLLLTVRYIQVLFDEYRRLRRAMRARAFVPGSNRHSWRSLGWLIGMLLVRSLERSQRILGAMKCRGFDGRLYLLDDRRWHPRDSLALVAVMLLLTPLLVLENSL